MPGVSDSAYLGGAGMGAATSTVMGFINNMWADARARRDRQANYYFGELAANNADKRTRALYNDFYSPEALLRQYEQAGLSPSMMFGGTPGQGGMSGARGSGASGPTTPFMPLSMVEAAQAELLLAQTKKTNAETSNIEQDTTIKEIQTAIQNMSKEQYATEFSLMNATWSENGKETSMSEIAENSYTYDIFLERVREGLKGSDLAEMTTSETGQKVLRSIYIAQNKMHRDIAILSNEEVSANFQTQIVSAMENTDFAKLNADAAVSYLKANIQTAELNETQKEAWNNLISKLGQKGSTTRDIIVVLGMILNQAASKWHMPDMMKK